MRATTQRTLFYAALLLAVGIGAIVDVFTKRTGLGDAGNNVAQILVILVCSLGWARADARIKDRRVGRIPTLALFVFPPVGIAVHLFRTRSILRAVLVWIAYFGGLVISAIAFGSLGLWLSTLRRA